MSDKIAARLKYVGSDGYRATMSFYWQTSSTHDLDRQELAHNLWDTIDFWSFWTLSLLNCFTLEQYFSWVDLCDERGTIIDSIKLSRQQWHGTQIIIDATPVPDSVQVIVQWILHGQAKTGYTQFPQRQEAEIVNNKVSPQVLLDVGLFSSFHVQDRIGDGSIFWAPSIPTASGLWRPIIGYQTREIVSRQLHRRGAR